MSLVNNLLNNMIKDKQKQINEIDAEISELEERKQYAKAAKEKFDGAYNELMLLHSDVTTCFKGKAADAFANKVFNLSIFSYSRSSHMEKQIKNFNKQLKELEKQKAKAEKVINMIKSIKKIFKS